MCALGVPIGREHAPGSTDGVFLYPCVRLDSRATLDCPADRDWTEHTDCRRDRIASSHGGEAVGRPGVACRQGMDPEPRCPRRKSFPCNDLMTRPVQGDGIARTAHRCDGHPCAQGRRTAPQLKLNRSEPVHGAVRVPREEFHRHRHRHLPARRAQGRPHTVAAFSLARPRCRTRTTSTYLTATSGRSSSSSARTSRTAPSCALAATCTSHRQHLDCCRLP